MMKINKTLNEMRKIVRQEITSIFESDVESSIVGRFKTLLEIGDSLSNSYDYSLKLNSPDSIEYTFTLENGIEFLVAFDEDAKTGVWFRTYEHIDKKKKSTYETGFNDPYRIASTVTKITLEFLRKNDISLLYIYHIKHKDDIKSNKNKRAKLHGIYLQKNMLNGFKFLQKNNISVIIPDHIYKSIQSNDDINRLAGKVLFK